MSDYIYTEEDMKIARNAVEHLKKEYKNSQSLIWAIAMQEGGTLKIDQRLLMESTDKGNELTTWNDQESLHFCIKAS